MASAQTAVEPRLGIPLRRMVAVALLTASMAAMVVAIIFLTQSQARWSSDAASTVWPAAKFRVVNGTAKPDDERLIVSKSGSNGTVIITLPTVRLDARDYGAIEARIRGLAGDQKVSVFWRSAVERQLPYTMRTTMVNAELFRAPVQEDPGWNGEIIGLGILIIGPVRPALPIVIESLRVVTVSASGIAGDTARDWFSFKEWNGQSINVVLLGAESEPVALPVFVAASTLVGLAAWVLLARRRTPRVLVAGAFVIVAVGWLTLDLRWVLNLAQQASSTTSTFAGKTWREKRLADDDQELFRFIERARLAIAQQPGRVFFTSDFAYFRARAGYHLLPLNAVANVYHRELYDTVYYRPGDYICFFARSGVRYDASTQMLSLDGKPPIHAEPVGAQGFGALYRVLG